MPQLITSKPENQFPLQNQSYKIIGLCMEVHRELGPGFLEIVYKDALEVELKANQIPYEREKPYRVNYKGITLKHNFQADFVVNDQIILEVKAQKGIIDEHFKWVINYLAVSKCKLGLIINFGEKSLATKRVVL